MLTTFYVQLGVLQVSELRTTQKMLERRLHTIYYVQLGLCIFVVIFMLYLFLSFIFDFFPFGGTFCSPLRGCAYNVWRD